MTFETAPLHYKSKRCYPFKGLRPSLGGCKAPSRGEGRARPGDAGQIDTNGVLK